MPAVLITLEATPRIGGVASYISYALEGARLAGYEVQLAAPRGSVDAQIELPCTHEQSWLNLWRAAQAFKQIKTEVIYLAEAAALRAALWAWEWTLDQRIRLILHGSEVIELQHSWRFQALLRHTECIYVLSHFVAELICKVDPTAAPKIIITGAAPCPTLPRLAGPRNPHHLLTVARLHPRKGQEAIIRAMANGDLPGFHYHIVGPTRGSTYAAKLQKLAAGLPVTFHGALSPTELIKVYQQCGIFVLAGQPHRTRVEGFGLVLLDAAAMGLVAIALNTGGVREAICDGRTGIVAANMPALIGAVRTLATQPDTYAALASQAHTYAQSLSWQSVADKLFAH